MEKLKEIFFRKNNFNFYKRMLALTLALVMIFNLTYDVFAQNIRLIGCLRKHGFPVLQYIQSQMINSPKNLKKLIKPKK